MTDMIRNIDTTLDVLQQSTTNLQTIQKELLWRRTLQRRRVTSEAMYAKYPPELRQIVYSYMFPVSNMHVCVLDGSTCMTRASFNDITFTPKRSHWLPSDKGLTSLPWTVIFSRCRDSWCIYRRAPRRRHLSYGVFRLRHSAGAHRSVISSAQLTLPNTKDLRLFPVQRHRRGYCGT